MADWRPISELFEFSKGTLQSSKATPGQYPFITAAEEWKTHKTYTHDCEALIFAMAASGSLGRTHYIKGKFISSDLCFILTPKEGIKLDLNFYHRLFNFLRQDIVKKLATGTSKLAINQTSFGAYKLPYFDYSHQLQFRNKLEEIIRLKDTLQTETENQESVLIKLRQQILQNAIEGKLTSAWRNRNQHLLSGENRAEKILQRIKIEKTELFGTNKPSSKKSQHIRSKIGGKFELPSGWEWCILNDIAVKIHYGLNTSAIPNKKDVRLLRITDIQDNKVNWDNVPGCQCTDRDKKSYLLSKDDIVIARTGGTIGKSFHLKTIPEPSLFASYLIRIVPSKNISPSYLKYFLESPEYWKQLTAVAWGAGQPNVSGTSLSNLEIPLPPYNEQQAIVEQADKLLFILNELKEQITERESYTKLLMQSILREAFSTETCAV